MKLGAALLVLCLVPRAARAQRFSEPSSPRQPSASAAPLTLRDRLGLAVADTLLRSQNPLDRQRGFERLGSIATAQALDLLLKAFETAGAARSAKDRLIAVRALSTHAAVPAVRDFLVRVMVGVGSNPERPEAIDGMIERAAALALAATGDEAALSALGKALRQPGHVADTARDALLAFPPRNLQPLLVDLRSPTRAFASLLGELGDVRAIPALRELVRGAPVDVRPDAAVALAKLGVVETIELARYWLAHEKRPDFQLASARILLQWRAPDAADAVRRLLLDETNHAVGLELASGTSLPALAPDLLRLAGVAPATEQGALFSALALTGTHESFSFLKEALGARATSSAAALALALSPDAQAEAVLEHALGVASTRRAALRAAIVRRVALARTPSGFAAAASELARSSDASDRAVSAQAEAQVAMDTLPALLEDRRNSTLFAVSRLALLEDAAPAMADRLAKEQNPLRREALAACLVSPAAAERVPSTVLLALIDARGLAAPLAARTLATRDSRILRPNIALLLRSTDALLRAQVALGLGQSKDGSALGLLEQAYRFETDGSVRLAIVHALAARMEPARQRALKLARSIDAAPEVRQAAALALAGAQPERAASGSQAAWLELSFAPGSAPALGSGPALGALLITQDGLALPAFADPDGVLLFPGLPSGAFELRLAAPARTEDALASLPP